MAWTMGAELAAAAASPDRIPVTKLFLWLDGDDRGPQEMTHLDVGWSINRQPGDSPEQVSRFAGSIAAQATITLAWLGPAFPGDGRMKSSGLAAYVGTHTGVRDHDFGIGMKVTLHTGFQTGPTTVETIQRFAGRVDDIQVGDDGTLTLTCLDYCADLQDDASLPPIAVADDSVGLPVYMCVEHLLRGGGFLRTPAPLSDCVLSVPGLLPEIGDIAAPLRAEPNPLDNLGAYPAPSYDNTYSATVPFAQVFDTHVVIEMWVRTAGISADRTLVSIGDANSGIRLVHTSVNRLSLQTTNGTVIVQSGAYFLPSDNAWHYIAVDWLVGQRADFRCDVTTHSVIANGILLNGNIDTFSQQIIVGGLVHEGLTVRYVPPDVSYIQTWRNTWTPNYGVDYRGTSPKIRAIPRGQQGTILDLIRAIAESSGAVFRWGEGGVWRWEERDSWVQRRIAAPVADHDHTRTLLASGYSYSGASRRSQVTIDWSEYTLLKSTLAAPAWEATDVITIRAGRTDMLDFDTDQPILGLFPVIRTSVQSADYSTVQTVPARLVGDPAAQNATGLQVRLIPTATGFRAIIRNSSSLDISLWDPTTGGPAFRVRGWTVTGGTPRFFTAQSSPRSREALTLPASAWRQNRAEAVSMCEQVAAETALPAVVFEQQRLVSDPSITVDDVIRLRAPDIMNDLVPAQIIGMTETDVELTLTVRACYPPTGWVLGVPGRTELDNLILTA